MLQKRQRIVIVGGCGHVGIPLGLALATQLHDVVLLDRDECVVGKINKGHIPYQEEGAEEVSFEFPVMDDEDDEDLVGLSTEEALALKKQKAEAAERRRQEYEQAVEEGNALLSAGEFAAAEKKFEEADAHYARLIESKNSAPKEVIAHLICERLYIEIITRRRREELCKLYTSELAQTMQKMRDNPTVLRTEYAFAVLCEGNPHRAATILEEFNKIERRTPAPNSLRSDKELIKLVDTLAYEGYRTLF